MRPRPTRIHISVTMLLVVGLMYAAGPARASGQTLAELTRTPEAAAELFIRSLRTIRWGAAAQFLDPEALAQFRELVTMITEVDGTGGMLAYLTGTDSAGYAALDDAAVFDRALTALTAGMPGLAHSLVDRDDEVLGHVDEGADSAHVVYRTQMRIGGSVPEVNVMQMRAGPAGWRVLWSEELYVLQTALRGASRLR